LQGIKQILLDELGHEHVISVSTNFAVNVQEHALDNVVAGKHVSGAPLVSNNQLK